jgi:hypothetical protein
MTEDYALYLMAAIIFANEDTGPSIEDGDGWERHRFAIEHARKLMLQAHE